MSAAQQLSIATRGFRTGVAGVDQLAIETRGYRLHLVAVVVPGPDYGISTQSFCIDYNDLLTEYTVDIIPDIQYVTLAKTSINLDLAQEGLSVPLSIDGFEVSVTPITNVIELFRPEVCLDTPIELTVELRNDNDFTVDIQRYTDMIAVEYAPQHIDISMGYNDITVTYSLEPYEVATSNATEVSLEYPEIEELPIDLVLRDSPCENNS